MVVWGVHDRPTATRTDLSDPCALDLGPTLGRVPSQKPVASVKEPRRAGPGCRYGVAVSTYTNVEFGAPSYPSSPK